MDREALTRAARRRRAQEELDFEREREAMLLVEIEDLIAETDGPAVDEGAFAQMDAADVEVVRATLQPAADFDDEEEDAEETLDDALGGTIEFGDEEDDDDPEQTAEDELSRLSNELEESRRRQRSFERYLAALDGS